MFVWAPANILTVERRWTKALSAHTASGLVISLRFFQRYLTLKVLTGFTPTAIGLFAKNVFANFFQVLYFWVFGATDILVSHKSNLHFNNLFKFR
jgi:hypothetical protein